MKVDRDVINVRFMVIADLLDLPEPARPEAVLWLAARDALDAVEAIATRHGIGRDFLLIGPVPAAAESSPEKST